MFKAGIPLYAARDLRETSTGTAQYSHTHREMEMSKFSVVELDKPWIRRKLLDDIKEAGEMEWGFREKAKPEFLKEMPSGDWDWDPDLIGEPIHGQAYPGYIKVRPEISLVARMKGIPLKALARAWALEENTYNTVILWREEAVVIDTALREGKAGYLFWVHYNEGTGYCKIHYSGSKVQDIRTLQKTFEVQMSSRVPKAPQPREDGDTLEARQKARALSLKVEIDDEEINMDKGKGKAKNKGKTKGQKDGKNEKGDKGEKSGSNWFPYLFEWVRVDDPAADDTHYQSPSAWKKVWNQAKQQEYEADRKYRKY